ncbi:MAG: stage III sporulation AC/AD family protein [Oscillospiraceae bacterium]
MELVIKAAVLGISGAILTLLIKKTNPEFSTVLAIAVCAVILGLAMKMLSSVMEVMELIELGTGFSSAYVAPVLKCMGIGITAKLGSDICKDSGQAAMASSVEICGAVCALYVSLPLIKTLLRMIGELS